MIETVYDAVNPPHYGPHRTMEGIDILREFLGDEGFQAYLMGSALKYIYRYKDKGKPIQDLEKACWFLNRLKSELGNETDISEHSPIKTWSEFLKDYE